MKHWQKVFLGSLATYLAVAACAAETHSDGFTKAVDAGLDAVGLADVFGLDGAQGADVTSPTEGGSIIDPVPEAKAKSGSRLKLYKSVGTDGSEFSGNFYDSQRNEDCYGTVSSDGKVRCLPMIYAASVQIYFADAQCTQQLAVDPYAGSPPKYASKTAGAVPTREADGSLSTQRTSLFPIATQYAGPVYFKSTTCQAAGSVSTYRYFTFSSTEVAPAAFVEFVTQREP